MSANRLLLIVFLLLGAWVLVAGCGSDPVAPTQDEAPILPPENVTAASSDVSKLIISWDPNSHPQLAGYNVYRMAIETQETTKLTVDPITSTSYEDMSARRGVEYEYRVTAITKAGKESIYASVTVLLQASQQQGYHRQEI
jgi:fibronectin type 3 domain-containing protein